MNYYGLDALAHGATAALVVFLPAVVLFWRLTRSLTGMRPLRPFVAVCAAYGIAIGGAGLWAANFERASFVDEAMGGGLLGGAIFALLAFLVLLLFPHRR
ncbi:hypothetical protein [Neoroseomonas lacus]|uniref:Uncharacterized protein n=1 Tax=Neoroseomonas lacus TaxID=287609 RepID=A0A917NJP8_9PROT|nr:hypothetical protein [Neoroseomonas lacus]GGJ05694.1 hypothetical protein GCM10011320_10690 [Neoroseomonas lacus]